MLTVKRAWELFDYRGGHLVRRLHSKAGKRAGRCIDRHGYVMVFVDGQYHREHRLIWFMVHGDWPAGYVDHINGEPGDNRIENLRDASPAMNRENTKRAAANSKSGLLGVCRQGNRFQAQIGVDGRKVNLGRFDTAEGAHEAYLKAKRELHAGCTI
jgi:hypothetical protein